MELVYAFKQMSDVIRLGSGTTRQVFTFAGSNSVFKLPSGMTGIRCNQIEVAYYEQNGFYGHPVVPCRLLWTDYGLPIVVMEKVDVHEYWTTNNDKPAWGYNNDGGQVARSTLLGGQWAAFDATYPLTCSDLHKRYGFHGAMELEYDARVEHQFPTINF